MIIKVNLETPRVARADISKILLPEDNISVSFVSSTYSLGTLLVTVKNGETSRQYKTNGKPIDITPLCKMAGPIDMEISKMINCEAVKTWRAEPLLLCEVEHGFEAIPEIEALKDELNNVKGAIRELVALIKENETM